MDKRIQASKGDWFHSFNENNMRIIIIVDDEEIELPAHYQVCDVCEGTGKHCNPSIDSHGLTYEDFDEDPDFAESYFSGRYDVTCYQCKGRRVYPEVCENLLTKQQAKVLEDYLTELRSMRMIEEYERRYGA